MFVVALALVFAMAGRGQETGEARPTAGAPPGPGGAQWRPPSRPQPGAGSGQAVEPRSKGEPPPVPALALQVTNYVQSLRQLAEEARGIEQAMPTNIAEMGASFGRLRATLTAARSTLGQILTQQKQVEAQGEKVMGVVSEVQQSFFDLAKEVAGVIERNRRNAGSNPGAVENVVATLTNVQITAEHGAALMVPFRTFLLDSKHEVADAFEELRRYPEVFELCIRACEMYQRAFGEPGNYAELARALTLARRYVREIVVAFTQATGKAESAMRCLPAIGSPIE